MANYTLDFSSTFSTGWEYAKKYGLLVAVVYLGVGIVTGGLQNLLGGSINPQAYERLGEAMGRGDWETVAQYSNLINGSIMSSFANVLSVLISLVVSVALYNLALGLMNGRFSAVTPDAFKLPVQTYVKVVAVELLVGIALTVSMFFCIIPFFFLAPRLLFAPIYQIENPEAGVIDSIKASWEMTSGNTVTLLVLGLAMAGILFVGFLCCCVGIYFAEAIQLFTLIAAYYQLKNNLA